jgi:hypothetical protein
MSYNYSALMGSIEPTTSEKNLIAREAARFLARSANHRLQAGGGEGLV